MEIIRCGKCGMRMLLTPTYNCDCKKNDEKTELEQLYKKIAAIITDIRTDSKKISGVEYDYYISRLEKLLEE